MNKITWLVIVNLLTVCLAYGDEKSVKDMTDDELICRANPKQCKAKEEEIDIENERQQARNELMIEFVNGSREEIFSLRKERDEAKSALQNSPKESSNGVLWFIVGAVAGGSAAYFGSRSIK